MTTLSPKNPDIAREIKDNVANGQGKLRKSVSDEDKWLAIMMPRDRTTTLGNHATDTKM